MVQMSDIPGDDKKREKMFDEEKIFDDDLMVRHIGDISILQCNRCGKVIGIMKTKNFYFHVKMVRNCEHLRWESLDKKFTEDNPISFEILVSHSIFGAIGKDKYYLLYKLPDEEDEEGEDQES